MSIFGNSGGNSPFDRPINNPFGGFGRKREAGSRRVSPLTITAAIVVVLFLILVSLSGFYADILWFKSVGFLKVWQTILFTQIALFIGFGFLT
ncbi:MAG: UPF0182 family protein, partial [Candidatus Fonsibacter sp.]